jgi:AcrR family transcriptional regulator
MSSVRRSQAQRSATTRTTLLDATIDCLIEEGYASTTTSRVAERAGLSRGAHLHHFQTRNALVAAAVEQLAERWLGELRRASEQLPDGPGRTVAGLDLLWAHYASPLYQAALDLWTDARNDPDLRERLVEVERLLDRQTLELADHLFPPRADMRELVQLSVATVRGLAMLDTLHPDGARSREQWAFIRPRLAAMFTDSSSTA